MSLQTVEILLNLENDRRVMELYDRYEAQLLHRLQRSKPEITSIPPVLTYIVDELTIARFNRIGSEGISKEEMDGHSATYQDESISLAAYEADIVAYLTPESGVSGGFKFI